MKLNKFLAAFITTFGVKLGLSFAATHNTEGAELNDAQQSELMTAMTRLTLPSAEDTASVQLAGQVRALALAATQVGTPGATTVDMAQFLSSHQFIANDRAQALTGAEASLTAVGTALTLTTEQLTAAQLPTILTQLKGEADAGRNYLQAKRTQAVELYKKTVGAGKEDASVIALFDKATDTEIAGLLKLHVKTATEKFGGKCNKCGSHEFSFQSSLEDTSTGTEDEAHNSLELNTMDLHRLASRPMAEETEKK